MTTAPEPAAATGATETPPAVAEVKDEIKATEAKATEARAEGDTAEAKKLEARLTSLEGKLDQLISRPFHPAPEEKTPETPPAAPAGTETPPAAETPATEEKTGRRASRRWFGDRA